MHYLARRLAGWLLICPLFVGPADVFAQSDPLKLWRAVPDLYNAELVVQPPHLQGNPAAPRTIKRRVFELDATRLAKLLLAIDQTYAKSKKDTALTGRFVMAQEPGGPQISVPTPDGEMRRFVVENSETMSPELAKRHPEVRTFRGRSVTGESPSQVRIEITPSGFHARVRDPKGSFHVEPLQDRPNYLVDGTQYASYEAGEPHGPEAGRPCLTPPEPHLEGARRPEPLSELRWGDTYRTYRLAVATTSAYAVAAGGSKSAAFDHVVRTINRVNEIYERELDIVLQLIPGEDDLIFTDSASDGFSNNDIEKLIVESQATIDRIVGTANYDIGHTFGTAGGGLAQRKGVMRDGLKARAATGLRDPTTDDFAVGYVAHEMGHQFGANHSFNGLGCGAWRNETTAYEPGSGTTILAYPGECGGDDLQRQSDAYFHNVSLAEITQYVLGPGETPRRVATGNRVPTVDAGVFRTLPVLTPFKLTAQVSNPAPGEHWTYVWEEFDLGGAAPLSAPDDGQIPLFRSRPPGDATRLFGLQFPGPVALPDSEKLPRLDRSSLFKVTARNPQAIGGVVTSGSVYVRFVSSAGPFKITFPNGSAMPAGPAIVRWDVAHTDEPPVAVGQVRILFSADGGATFPKVLLSRTTNNGQAAVVLPPATPGPGIIRVESLGNYFFADSRPTPIQ